MHFAVALAGFLHPHVEQLHCPAGAAAGGFIPAAAQLNPPLVAAGLAPGLGSSQATHFDAESVLSSMQVVHFHPPTGAEGAFIPAAAQLNPPEGTEGAESVESVEEEDGGGVGGCLECA